MAIFGTPAIYNNNNIIITHLYSALRSEDTEALAAQED